MSDLQLAVGLFILTVLLLGLSITLGLIYLRQWLASRRTQRNRAALEAAIESGNATAEELERKSFRNQIEAATGEIQIVPSGKRGRTTRSKVIAETTALLKAVDS